MLGGTPQNSIKIKVRGPESHAGSILFTGNVYKGNGGKGSKGGKEERWRLERE